MRICGLPSQCDAFALFDFWIAQCKLFDAGFRYWRVCDLDGDAAFGSSPGIDGHQFVGDARAWTFNTDTGCGNRSERFYAEAIGIPNTPREGHRFARRDAGVRGGKFFDAWWFDWLGFGRLGFGRLGFGRLGFGRLRFDWIWFDRGWGNNRYRRWRDRDRLRLLEDFAVQTGHTNRVGPSRFGFIGHRSVHFQFFLERLEFDATRMLCCPGDRHGLTRFNLRW